MPSERGESVRWAAQVLIGVLAFVGALQPGLPARGETAFVEAARDATLIEDADGALANGSGPFFFVGRNAAFVARRALLAFDVASALPPGAWITGVALEIEMTPSNETPIDVELHRVLTPWSEGPSSAGGGGGAPAEPGDSTWLHALYDTDLWQTPGGDFTPLASAVAPVGTSGRYVFASTPDLVADVWEWLEDPASNHGWILVGGEDRRQTAKSFASRESPMLEARPLLVVDYETSCDAFDLAPGAQGLCRAYCEALECPRPHARGSGRACDRLAHDFARRTGGMAPPCARVERGSE